jgi:cellulose biosynthesis protein BcsQ
MQVISVCSSKGGVGKTTLASVLAVRAVQDTKSKRVAMVDLDPQGSLAAWWKRRWRAHQDDPPTIFAGADTASEAVEKLELDGWDWVFIDTPPAFVNIMEDATASSEVGDESAKASMVPCFSVTAAVVSRYLGTGQFIPQPTAVTSAKPMPPEKFADRVASGALMIALPARHRRQ